MELLEGIVNPWYESLKNPAESQQNTLSDLLKQYEKTQYGQNLGADTIQSPEEFRNRFPTLDYKGLTPYLETVKTHDYRIILPEPPLTWVMTRGSTGKAKILPATKTHLELIFSCGARAFVNYVIKKNDTEMLTGRILNLNFPSVVATLDSSGQTLT